MVIHRGDIWWANLPSPVGSEPGYRRPILVVQDDGFNRSQIQTVIAVILTSNLNLSQAPGNVYLPRNQTSLPKDSVVNVSQIVTIDKAFLTEKITCLDEDLMERIDEGLRLVLYL
ncbi:putative PemK-like protein [Crocosphaera subtropica ATCC 51142]|uniref:mRNA interferase n=1 Tax=Crocosphaera subtropica (strain ATCC 51142 / BH68) TaxID=43989 RepID=B1X2A8_CROS5|nr:type II toxin-antitoxin system PemK/MazF family toxin [Crocosphaera subtropica]ACB54269.1 putative PemK-like protein [Crocosphaera subtropica ATCC 51142]